MLSNRVGKGETHFASWGREQANLRHSLSSTQIKAARVASAVAGEIQAWIDRETIARLVAALRQPDGGGAGAARALLGELEARLLSVGRFEPPARQGAGRAGLSW